MKNSISVIIPVFNEERTIAGVVNSLLNDHQINEVICINDGSTDKSLDILKTYGDKIRLINLINNQGKGYALSEGIKMAKGKFIVFIDADLVNLSPKHIDNLLSPILNGKCRVVLGYPVNGWLQKNMFSNLTGERVYYRQDLLPHLKKMAKTRFGVEVYLNKFFKKNTVKVPLRDLKGLLKYEKRNAPTAIKEYTGEAIEIVWEKAKNKSELLNKLSPSVIAKKTLDIVLYAIFGVKSD